MAVSLICWALSPRGCQSDMWDFVTILLSWRSHQFLQNVKVINVHIVTFQGYQEVVLGDSSKCMLDQSMLCPL